MTLVSFEEIGAEFADDAIFTEVFGVFNTLDFFKSLSKGGVIKFSKLGMGCFYKKTQIKHLVHLSFKSNLQINSESGLHDRPIETQSRRLEKYSVAYRNPALT